MKFLFNALNILMAFFLMAMPVFGVSVLSDTLSKVEALLNHIEETVQGTVDLSLVNSTLADINNLSDPLVNNLGSGIDSLLSSLLD
ncbi:unnamed protein product [Debaryomyces tyrocola]|nr:unnamed protein product [Debaryomyces tyrocola]